MKFFSKIIEILFLIFQIVLIVLLLLAFGAFVGVLFSECAEKYISKLLGLCEKNEALKFLGISMGGILIALQALMSYRRAKAMEGTAESQAKATEEQAKANQHTEGGQRQERLKNAIEHLGHKSDSVRLGGAYELFHLVEDTENEKLRPMVFDILCAHIRRTTGENEYQEVYKSKPSEEVQSLLTLLFVQKHEVFKGLLINLEESWLNGANLKDARLAKAILNRAHLRTAQLVRAQLQGAELIEAHMQEALLACAKLQRTLLNSARLQGAALAGAELQGVKLDKAQLQGAKFFGTQLQGAALSGAQLQGAELIETHLQGAALFEAQLQGAALSGAQLQGANSDEWASSASFESLIRSKIGEKSDLSEAIFEGGLSKEDVDALVEGLSDEKANELRKRLDSHIGQPKSNKPPDHNADTSSYTEEEAEQWIAEYKQAVGDDS